MSAHTPGQSIEDFLSDLDATRKISPADFDRLYDQKRDLLAALQAIASCEGLSPLPDGILEIARAAIARGQS